MRILGIPIKISPLLPVLLLIGMVLGLGPELGVALTSLVMHEFSHALAARALHVRVQEIELMPMGGAARMNDIWSLRPGQVVLIALAGPAANLLLILFASSLAWGRIIGPYTAMLWIRMNIVMMLFNLLPALPLDGGRVLCALVRRIAGDSRALRWFTALGTVVGIALIALAAWMLAFWGMLNVTLVFTGAFLIASAARERHLAQGSPLLSFLKRQEELTDEGILPVRHIAARDTQSPVDILPRMQPRSLHRVAVYSDQLALLGILEEGELLSADGAKTLQEILEGRNASTPSAGERGNIVRLRRTSAV